MQTEQPYDRAWRTYRRWVRAFFLGWLGLPIGLFLLTGLWVGLGHPRLPGFVFGPIAGAGMVTFLVSSVALSSWRCPRCQSPFFMKWLWRNPFARKCMHCGLPKWARGPDDPGRT